MSLEEKCRRKPDVEGIGVKLRNNEVWKIPAAGLKPIFEKEDGQWLFRRFDMVEPFKAMFDRIRELWGDAADEGRIPYESVTELTKLTMELSASALEVNYELTPEQLGDLIDPTDHNMAMSILKALKGLRPEDKPEDEPVETEDEKKN